jgi:hypothetical protein
MLYRIPHSRSDSLLMTQKVSPGKGLSSGLSLVEAGRLRCVCSDMLTLYLKVLAGLTGKRYLCQTRFHITMHSHRAVLLGYCRRAHSFAMSWSTMACCFEILCEVVITRTSRPTQLFPAATRSQESSVVAQNQHCYPLRRIRQRWFLPMTTIRLPFHLSFEQRVRNMPRLRPMSWMSQSPRHAREMKRRSVDGLFSTPTPC